MTVIVKFQIEIGFFIELHGNSNLSIMSTIIWLLLTFYIQVKTFQNA